MGDKNDKLTRYQKQMKSKQGQSSVRLQGQLEKKVSGSRESVDRTQQRQDGDKIDSIFGFDRMKEGLPRVGWLLNYLPISMPDETGIEKSGMDLYFIERGSSASDTSGGNFKATVLFEPYFYLDISDPRRMMEITNALLKRYEGCKVQAVEREDLDLPNHLSGKKHPFLKMSFGTTNELNDAKNQLRPIIAANQKRLASAEDYLFSGSHDDSLISYIGSTTSATSNTTNTTATASTTAIAADPLSYLIDFREHDVPYTVRVSIDLNLRIGAWYTITPEYTTETCLIQIEKEIIELCEPRILAFDIECEKSPLKFPNADVDRIFMISYMVKGQGFLIINRDVVSEDIEDFEYTPKPSFPGPFKVFNEKDEEATLRKFVSHVQELRPHVIVTYNGDKFDWPYVETRCKKYSYLNLYTSLGIRSTIQSSSSNNGQKEKKIVSKSNKDDDVEENTTAATAGNTALFSDNEYTGRCIVHLDAFCWVQRDSYLPQGNQGLKAVTKYKLGYDPVEVDPEDMLRFAREKPHHMASYSVSDAVATYYLYTTYVHNFIFSLSTIIPLPSEDVLRKGSGTLCEMLLMVEAYNGNIVCPNKQTDPLESFHEGHLMESETYIGGHVECLEAGVFRADIPAKFTLVPSALQHLIEKIDRDLTFTLEVEHGCQRSDAVNYDEIRQLIVQKLEMLRDSPLREESPIIYHLDVGAMYPNIILTNRLQPSAMVSTAECAACVYNKAENNCKRPMNWVWRGEFSPTGYAEYQSVKRQLQYERLPSTYTNNTTTNNRNNNYTSNHNNNQNIRTFNELPEKEQISLIRTRLKAYSTRVYRKTKITSTEERTNTVCMRENSFYVDTVKAFRDRRYDYKLLTKEWKNKKISAEKANDQTKRKVSEDMEILMDSLQLAHKCILNSFYGYVMRKGARWKSMEMAGIVTYTGAQLIKQARELIEQVGRPLELDTDGIWCILPSSFPQDFKIKMKNGSSVTVGYPCAMLNADVHERYTNHQYQELQNTTGGSNGGSIQYATHSECSIFFELDGPYKAMILPASPEEGKLLKKKYVVFNFNNTIAELKGFELKRRGELELIKIFQSQVFEHFTAGKNLQECYEAVGTIANQWLDVLDSCGINMDSSELLELISEKKTISKTFEQYDGRKSTSLTTAARLADFLGSDMIKDKGLNCHLIISKYPTGAPVTDRAIPVAIFSCELTIQKYFLRKWLRNPSLECEDFRQLVDWGYYKERLGKSIQKIITIPAGIQRVLNPCPRVEHPVWLQRDINEQASGRRQISIMSALSTMRIAADTAKAAATASSTAATASSTAAAPMLLTDGSSNITKPIKSILTTATDTAIEDAQNKPKKRVRIQLEGEESLPDPTLPVPHNMSSIPDLEDFGSANTTNTSGIVRISNYHSTQVASNSVTNTTDIQEITENIQIIALNELPDGKHSNADQFSAWLQDRKTRWKELRKQKQQLKKELMQYGTSSGSSGSKKSMGVADLVRNASLAASMGFWQIIEIQESDRPGDFIVWAMTATTQLQRLNIVVPRQLYVNITTTGKDAQLAATNLGGVRVKRDLPHGKQCRELFEVSIPEKKYQRNERALNLFLCNSQVEGVYESQVPLWLRAVITMGCVAKVNARAQQSTTNRSGFKLHDLDLVHIQAHPYLNQHTAIYRRIFIYFAADKTRTSGDLGILALFQIDGHNLEHIEKQQRLIEEHLEQTESEQVQQPQQTTIPLSGKAYVWLINGRAGHLDSRPPLQRIYRKFQPNELGEVKFTQSFASTVSAAWGLCNERLTQYQSEHHGPTIVIVQGGQSSDATSASTLGATAGAKLNTQAAANSTTGSVGMDARQWRHAVPALHDFPLTVMPANSVDQLFPAVGWQMFTAERMVQRFLIFPRWFDDRLACARYAHVPLCNLGSDALTTMIDVTFSRQLTHNRHLLWASEGAPDLGEGADNGQELLDIWAEALKEPIINIPGVYRGACVELDLYGMAVCAIMSSGELDAEGLTTLAMAPATNTTDAFAGQSHRSSSTGQRSRGEDSDNDSDGAEEGFDETTAGFVLNEGGESTSDASCARAFNIFKAMIAKCIEEVSAGAGISSTNSAHSGNSGIADSILTAVYRYLCGYGSGLLSDPLLHRVIYGLMTKLFQKLVGGLRRLGTKVVYADFGRIIISTDKHDLASAQEYVDFILAALGNKPTFAYLQVSVKAYWEQMCWLGPENWGALPLIIPVPLTESVDLTEEPEVLMQGETEGTGLMQTGTTESDTEEDEPTDRLSTKKPESSPIPSRTSPVTTDKSPKKTGKKTEDEFDFLDDIQGASDKSGSNIANIKKFFGHKAAPTSTTAAGTGTGGDKKKPSTTMGTAKSYASSKHNSVRDPSPHSVRHHSEDSDNESTDSYRIAYDSDADSTTSEMHAMENEEVQDSTGLQAHWNLATYLPDAAAEYFHLVIAEFLQQYKAKREQLLLIKQHSLHTSESGLWTGSAAGSTGNLSVNSTGSAVESTENLPVNSESETGETAGVTTTTAGGVYMDVLLDDKAIDDAVAAYMRQLIKERLTPKLMELVDDLNMTYTHEQHRGHTVFPHRAGSHLTLTSPALEFVKATTHVMGLDPQLAQEVTALRRLLLTQLKVREFSGDSVFRDPCLSYTLRDVICSYCSSCRDLDLLRDAGLTDTDPAKRWRCKHCSNRINTEEVENRLLEATDKLSASFLLQDFRCKKTHRVARRLGSAVSDLCDPLVMDTSREAALQQLQTLRQVATFHGFTVLKESVEELMV